MNSPQALLPNTPKIRLSVFLISLSMLLWEVLLTRIYSVMFYYHFAFLAVSVAMFGITLGTLLVLLCPSAFPDSSINQRLSLLAWLTGTLMVCVIPLQLRPLFIERGSWAVPYYLGEAYILSSLPFIPAGAFICLALTRYQRVGLLYAFDLVGAGVGSILLPLVLTSVGGPGAVFIVAALCAAAAFFVYSGASSRRWLYFISGLAFFGFSILNVHEQWLRVRWRHDGPLPVPMYESWNAFSRIMITPFPSVPFTWATDPALIRGVVPPEQLFLQIDAGAGTPITRFTGDTQPLDYLRYDLTSFVHQLKPTGSVMIIGVGGGRDVLTALVFGHSSISAAEVNGNIAKAVNGVFGDFSGHLDRDPRVHYYVEEGRHYLEQSNEQFDVIQASLVDSAAATAAGAYAFVESSLYTQEAWQLFLRHLKPNGILSFSRWYLGTSSTPSEIYRLVALASAALRAEGISDPSRYMLLVRGHHYQGSAERLATLLVSRDPYSPQEVATAQRACAALHFEMAYSFVSSMDPYFQNIIDDTSGDVVRQFPLDISAPTDDRPFFFFNAKVGNMLRDLAEHGTGGSSFNAPAIRILFILLILSSVLGIGLVILPVIWLVRKGLWTAAAARQGWRVPLYFGTIGLAFMFVEIALMQRLGLYLGHPTYGFTVSLAGLMIFSGLGSGLLEKFIFIRRPSASAALLPLLAIFIVLLDLMSAGMLRNSVGNTEALRIGLTLALIALPGVLMGGGFPMVMRLVHQNHDPRSSWYWAINGAFSVIGSVLAVVVSFAAGLHLTFITGAALYLLAGILYRSNGFMRNE